MRIEEITELRSVEQNRLMWALLNDFAVQVPWIINGVKCFMSALDWKAVATASLRKELRVAPLLDGEGFVFLQMRTSKLSKERMTELIEFLFSEGTKRGVIWTGDARDYLERA